MLLNQYTTAIWSFYFSALFAEHQLEIFEKLNQIHTAIQSVGVSKVPLKQSALSFIFTFFINCTNPFEFEEQGGSNLAGVNLAAQRDKKPI